MSAKGVWILCLLSFFQLTNSAEESEAILDTTTSDTNSPQSDIIETENNINNDEEINNNVIQMDIDTDNDVNMDEETNNDATKLVTETEIEIVTEMVTEAATENVTKGIMEGKIVGGELTSLDKNPHAAYLAIACKMTKETKRFGCGSSILNHEVLITAAHCLALCSSKSLIAIATASENKFQGLNNTAKHFLLHPKFEPRTLAYDIALVRINNKLTLGPRIKRVILMRKPPKIETAYLAGWGLVDEKQKISSKYLKQTTQKIISKEECKRTLKTTPAGTICAKAVDKRNALYGYAAKGDSGSGLIGEDYILRGIVSHKNPKVAASVIVYTDTSYFYYWTWQSTQQLMCME